MTNVWRRVAGLALLAGIVAVLVWAFWPAPVGVDIAEAVRRPLVVSVSDEGTTRIREIYTVSAPVGGKVTRSPREVGDVVEAGKTLLATIEPSEPAFLDIRSLSELSAAVAAAEAGVVLAAAELTQAKARRTFAESDLKRAKSLLERKTISAREFEERALELANAQADVGTAEAAAQMRRRELESARARLIQPGSVRKAVGATCCVRVASPIDGVVIDIPVESEQVVAAGTALIRLGDPEDLEIVVELLSHEAVRVSPGARAFIDGWGGPRLAATVRRVAPAAVTEISALGIEEQRVEVVLDLDEASTERLGHNFRVIAHVVVDEAADALTIPLGALFRREGEWAAFAVRDGVARLTELQTGKRSDTLVEVLSGLAEGDTVVVHPSDAVTDGRSVAQRQLVTENR